MSMRLKVLCVLLPVAVAVVVADYLVERTVVMPQFAALEREEARRNLDRIEQAFAREVQEVAQNTRDYAKWDDAYRFIETRDPQFIASNLAPEIFRTLRLNLVHFYDSTDGLVWGETRNAETTQPIQLTGLPETGLLKDIPFLRPRTPKARTSGVLKMGRHVLFVASCPITPSNSADAPRGTVVFGRLLTPKGLDRLQRQTNVRFALMPPETPLPAAARPEVDELAALDENAPSIAFDESDPDRLLAYAAWRDLCGTEIGRIAAELPRDITAKGRRTLAAEVGWLGGAAAVLLGAAYVGLGLVVVRPVQRLSRHVTWLRQSGDLNRRLNIHSNDEVGTLAGEFDLLLSQLARSRTLRLRSENRLNAVLQDHPDMIRRFTPDGLTTYVNRAYAQYLGRSEDSLLGRKSEMPIPAEDRERMEAQLAVLSVGRPSAEITHRVVRADGALRTVRWTVRVICDEDGVIVEYQAVGKECRESANQPEPEAEAAASS